MGRDTQSRSGLKAIALITLMSTSGPALSKPYMCYFNKGDRFIASRPFEVGESEVKKISYMQTNLSSSWKDHLAQKLGISEVHNYYGCFSTTKENFMKFIKQTEDNTGRKTEFIRWDPYGLSASGEDSSAAISIQENDGVTARTESDEPSAPTPKYIEVAGPNGVMRLSPEVVARNKAAAEDYQRKLKEHADAVAKAKADNERSAAQHAESMARAAAEKQEYERKLAANAAQVAAQKAQPRGPMGGNEGSDQATKGAKGWMYCDARGAPGDKRRYYSRVTEVEYVPGEITIIDVMAKNRPAFKSYIASAHSIYFATDSLLHCPYSTTSLADAEALMARDKRGDGNNAIEIIQTGWVPTN